MCYLVQAAQKMPKVCDAVAGCLKLKVMLMGVTGSAWPERWELPKAASSNGDLCLEKQM